MTCSDVSDEGAVWQPAATIDKVVAESIVREFRLHATRFDVLYEGRIQDQNRGN